MATRRAFISKQSSSNQQSPPTMGHIPFTSGPPTGISVYGISASVPSIVANYIGFTITGSTAAVTDTTFLSGGKYILIAQGNYSGYSNTETVDYVFVRSYLNPEPSVTAWGSINTP